MKKKNMAAKTETLKPASAAAIAPSAKTVSATPPKAAAPAIRTSAVVPQAPAPVATPARGRVSLELVKPDAKSVFVAGSFNGWKPEATPLVAKGNGHWVGDLTVNPGRHEYLFVVDGQWLPDPNAKEAVQNPFGGKNSVLSVSA